jgi:hypothetical protein
MGGCKWTIAARCRTADNSFSGALHPPVKGQRRETTREQPVGGRGMRMKRKPKKRIEGKRWKKHNKTREKKLNQLAHSSKSMKIKRKSQ